VDGTVVRIGIPIGDQTEASRVSDFEKSEGLGEKGQKQKNTRATCRFIRLCSSFQHYFLDLVAVRGERSAKIFPIARCTTRVSHSCEVRRIRPLASMMRASRGFSFKDLPNLRSSDSNEMLVPNKRAKKSKPHKFQTCMHYGVNSARGSAYGYGSA
jgi:hypothetical protein